MRVLMLGSKEYPFQSGAGFEKKPSGGIEVHVEKLAKYLAKDNYEVIVLTRKFPGQKEYEKKGKIKAYRVGFVNSPMLRGPSFNIVSFFRAFSVIKKERPELIHAHAPMAGFFGAVLSKRFRIPMVYTPHGTSKAYNHIFNLVLDALNRIAAIGASKTLFISSEARKDMVSKYRHFDNVLLTNGIDPDDFDLSSKRDWKELRFVFIGRLEEIKGTYDLLCAFAKLTSEFKKVRLSIVGSGSEEDRLKRYVRENELDDLVTFSGWSKKPLKHLGENDVYVLPSSETGLPFSLIEAKYAGKIIITSLPYIIDGKDGLYFAVGDVGALYLKMWYVAENFRKCVELGKEAQKSVKKLSWDKVVKGFEKEYEIVINNKSKT